MKKAIQKAFCLALAGVIGTALFLNGRNAIRGAEGAKTHSAGRHMAGTVDYEKIKGWTLSYDILSKGDPNDGGSCQETLQIKDTKDYVSVEFKRTLLNNTFQETKTFFPGPNASGVGRRGITNHNLGHESAYMNGRKVGETETKDVENTVKKLKQRCQETDENTLRHMYGGRYPALANN